MQWEKKNGDYFNGPLKQVIMYGNNEFLDCCSVCYKFNSIINQEKDLYCVKKMFLFQKEIFSEIIRVDVLSMYQFSKSATPMRNLPRINVDEVLLFPFPFPTGISRVLCHYFHSSQIYIGAAHAPSACLENWCWWWSQLSVHRTLVQRVK